MSDQKTTAGDFTRSLGLAIQSHPLPAALIGMGLVWLLAGGRSPIKAGDGFDDARAGPIRKVSDAGASTVAQNSQRFSRAQANIADVMDRQPLVLGAIGLSVGAAMAAALPSTAVETDLLGEVSADLQAKTRKAAADVTEQVADLADGVTSAIATEARAQGLTPENFKETTRDATRKIQKVVGQSADRVRSGIS
jgi:hypothetical protein